MIKPNIGKKGKIAIATGLAVVLAIGGSLAYIHSKKSKKPDFGGGKDMFTEKVQKGSIQETVTASGTVDLEDETNIYGEADGYKIKKFLVEEGDTVKAGQNVVEYDVKDTKTDLESKIRDAKRNIENGKLALEAIVTPKTQAEITKLENAVFTQQKAISDAQTTYNAYATKLSAQQTTIDNAKRDIDTANRDLSQAQSDLTQAQKDENTYKQLLSAGGVSQSEYDNYANALEKAQNTYENAKTSVTKAQATYTDAKNSYNDLVKERDNKKLEITSAQKALTQAQQELKAAKDPLSDEATKIKYDQQVLTNKGLEDGLSDLEEDLNDLVQYATTPVDGKVTEIPVDENSLVVDNTIMVKIANLNNLIVNANIEEYDAPQIKLGQTVTMTSDGLEGKTYTGKVTKISTSASDASTNSGTETVVPIEISVDNPDGVLKPGFNLDLEIMVVDKNDVLTVSTNAVAKDGKENTQYVYKVENDKLVKTTVETGDEGDSTVEITSGLKDGDQIISSNSEEIKDGMTLEEFKKAQMEKQQKAKDSQLSQIRNKKIGFVFQSFNLLPKLNALENVELPMVYAGIDSVTRRKKAENALEWVGLAGRMKHKPNEMSGGQRQRVAIARALVNDPAIILADEPTGNLDSKSTFEIIDIFQRLNEGGATIVMVTHEPDVAEYTKRIVTFKDGHKISDEIVENPKIAGGEM